MLRNGKPVLALGSPGGATIITTVLQMLFNRFDLGMSIEQAIKAPRASQRNTDRTVDAPSRPSSTATAPRSAPWATRSCRPGAPGTSAAEIGAATAIEFGRGGQLTAVSEPVRRGGGSALVVEVSPASRVSSSGLTARSAAGPGRRAA